MIAKFRTAHVIICFAVVLLSYAVAHAEDSPLGIAEKLARKHIESTLSKLPSFQNYGKEVGELSSTDAVAGSVQGIEGPRKHPWAQTGNPNSDQDLYLDSFFNLDAKPQNAFNWSQAWSCFEPKLLAKARNGREVVYVAGPKNEDLVAECRSKCVNYVEQIPFPRGSWIGAIMYRAFGCLADPDPWGYIDNGYEVVEFWFPEYQVSVNNFGINRIRPETLSPTGDKFTRKALLSQKQGIPETKIREGVEKAYPMDLSEAKFPEPRSDPYLGQGVATGTGAKDYEDKGYAHINRTWLSMNMGDKKKRTTAGWIVDPEFSLYDALPKTREDHDPVNVWTEYGMFDVITSIPQLSYKIRPDIMKALFGEQRPYTTAAVEEKPFWQTLGAAAFRTQRWPTMFSPLKTNFDITPNMANALKEAVYKGGYELFPLVSNGTGFGTPSISTAAVIARRALYVAGARKPAKLGGDESGVIESFFPQGADQGRIVTYTISSEDKGREIDKLQLISPKRPKYGQRYGGIPPIVSECFRSQNIPNYINQNQKLDSWVNRNLRKELNGYYSDPDFFSIQGGDITFTYWNRRIGCFCDRCGIPTGSSEINNGGDGDKLYDKPRIPYCRYPLLPEMTPWSAWAREDTFAKCQQNGQNESFYDGTGLKDAE